MINVLIQYIPYAGNFRLDTPQARDRVPRVRVKEKMADQALFSVVAMRMVKGYHAYKIIWTAVNGEELLCQRCQPGRRFCFMTAGLIELDKVPEGLRKTSSAAAPKVTIESHRRNTLLHTCPNFSEFKSSPVEKSAVLISS